MPERSRIVLNDDRTITIWLDGGQCVVLRPPTVEQWAEIGVAYLAAAEVTTAPESVDARALFRRICGIPLDIGEALVEAPYARALATVIGMLSNTSEPDPAHLPSWAAEQGLFDTFYGHWRRVEIIHGEIGDEEAATSPSPVTDSAVATPAQPWKPDPNGSDIPVFDLEAARADLPGGSVDQGPASAGMAGTGRLEPTGT